MPDAAETETPPETHRSGRRSLLLLVLVSALIGAGAWWYWGRTYHFATVQPGVLYRAGNRSAREFENTVQKVHARTVVCLVDDEEVASPQKPQFKEEFAFLKDQGVRLERIPIRLGGWPSSEDVQRFLRIVQQPENQPVIVHCAQGVRRTGMMVAAYQLSLEPGRYDKQKAKDAIQSFGHSDRTVRDVQKFIDVYDPQARTVPPMALSDVKE
jgi:protein tyrosine phosphatase (PTP) superfamily phosphohydrolase (DUF442 family)